MNEFVTVDLSAFYLDVSKDRLYTFRADAPDRRSAQTAQYVIADGLARLLAPILSVTCDEVWGRLPGARDPSVHLAQFPADADEWRDEALVERWQQLREVRAQVNATLEAARQRKEIGTALEAHVTVAASGAVADLLEHYRSDLPMFFITSSVDITRKGEGAVDVAVSGAAGDKCPRCWRFVTETVADGDLAGLCERCADAVGGTVAAGA